MTIENLNVFSARLLPEKDYFCTGHRACQGCAEALAVRLVHKALGRNTIVANATGCMEIIASSYPDSAWDLPWIHVAFENAASVCSGIESAYKALVRKGRMPDRKINFVAMGGDGATADIGLQFVSGAMERGHDMIYVCYDNEAYMNTGIQRSSSTPFGATTTTSPAGKMSFGQATWKKPVIDIMAAHRIPFAATASPSYPFDLMEKVKIAASIEGPCYLHIYSACPTGWRMAPELAIEVGRLAVQTGAFPLYEVRDGKRLTVSVKPDELRSLKDYTKIQGRFRHLTDDQIAQIQARIQLEWDYLLKREELGV
jgi:pyruvate ferredoxin oxidoreductase beta subunit